MRVGTRWKIASQVLVAAGLAFLLIRGRAIWHGEHVHGLRLDWLMLSGSVALAAAVIVASGLTWLLILRRLSVETQSWWVGVFFEAQLAKYIPGTIWQYAGRIALARSACRVPARTVAWSLTLETAATAAAAGAVSLLVFGTIGIAGTVLLLVSPTLLRLVLARRGSTRTATARTLGDAVAAYGGGWIATGVGFWLVARAVFAPPLRDLLFYIGAFALAWLVGLIAVYAPSGLGVREAMLVVLLRSRLGAADALVVAGASRAVLTTVEACAAAAGVALLRRRPRSALLDGGPAQPVPPPATRA